MAQEELTTLSRRKAGISSFGKLQEPWTESRRMAR